MKIEPDKVAIYIRWSTEDQSQGHTLEIQRESCRYYLLSQGWVVREDATFIDDGFSGGSLERPALTRLRQQVKAGVFQCVVVYKLDRLSRNIKDIINLVLDEWDGLCCVRSTQEPVDTTSDAGKMFFTMLGSFADFERSTIKTRTWSGKLKNAEKGLNPGIPHPYGYCKGEGSTFAIVEEEATIVRQCFEMYLRGLSCAAIARELNDRGIPSARNRGWSNAMIAKLLRNPIYTGRLVYNTESRVRKNSGSRYLRKDAGDVITFEGAAPVIIDRDMFQKVRRISANRPRVGRSGAARTEIASYLLTGMVRCTCGHSVTSYQNATGARYYYCTAAHTKGPAVCRAGMIPVAALDAAVVAEVRAKRSLRGALREQALQRLSAHTSSQEAEITLVRRRLDELGRSMEKAKRDYMGGKLAPEVYSDLVRDSRRESERLADQLRAAEEAKARVGDSQLDIALADETFDKLDQWETLAAAERKRVLQQLLSRVIVYRDRKTREVTVECEWRLPAPEATNA